MLRKEREWNHIKRSQKKKSRREDQDRGLRAEHTNRFTDVHPTVSATTSNTSGSITLITRAAQTASPKRVLSTRRPLHSRERDIYASKVKGWRQTRQADPRQKSWSSDVDSRESGL